jgi:deoxycytidine triphosphate deaminase
VPLLQRLVHSHLRYYGCVYLVDTEIREQLGALDIRTPSAEHPFDVGLQVQPCSIDLRIDSLVWRAGGRGTIDMRKALKDKIHPRRGWRSSRVSDGGVIVVKPRELVFARVYERFTMPPQFAGKIEGRSSFARLGLSIHATSDFINPGWYGNMPLQLYNAGPHTIRIPPYMPVCQLMLIRLSKEPERTYGHEDLDSKYMNDDGGPSYWWRDRRIKQLHERLKALSLPLGLEDRIAKLTAGREIEIIERFECFIDKLRVSQTHDEETILDRFAKREWWRRHGNLATKWGLGVVFAALLSIILKRSIEGISVLSSRSDWMFLGVLVALAVANLWFQVFRPKTSYLLPDDVTSARIEKARQEEARRDAAQADQARSVETEGPSPPDTPPTP